MLEKAYCSCWTIVISFASSDCWRKVSSSKKKLIKFVHFRFVLSFILVKESVCPSVVKSAQIWLEQAAKWKMSPSVITSLLVRPDSSWSGMLTYFPLSSWYSWCLTINTTIQLSFGSSQTGLKKCVHNSHNSIDVSRSSGSKCFCYPVKVVSCAEWTLSMNESLRAPCNVAIHSPKSRSNLLKICTYLSISRIFATTCFGQFFILPDNNSWHNEIQTLNQLQQAIFLTLTYFPPTFFFPSSLLFEHSKGYEIQDDDSDDDELFTNYFSLNHC